MQSNYIYDIFESFEKIPVLIIGDIMTDHYIFGNANRISPEAPVPILDVYKRESRLGGAANVALNIQALGATPILCSVIGDDQEGHALVKNLQAHHIEPTNLILHQDRKTTVKTRIVSKQHQLLRYDYEYAHPIDDQTELAFIDRIVDVIYNKKPQVVIFQDYNKGVLTPKVIANVINNCQQHGIPTAVDPKKDNFFEYKNCTLFKPNLREATEALNRNIQPTKRESLIDADIQIRAILSNQYTIITLSDKGMYVAAENDHDIIPANAGTIADVSGAGDTVISLMALGLALGLDIFATAELANLAAGIVCQQTGVVPVNKDRLIKQAIAFFGGE